MQKTAVIYGLAGATLIGAFLLVPREKAPPPPPPLPTPTTASPVTDLTYADGVLEVRARLDRGYVLPGSGEPLTMDIAVKSLGLATRAPLTAVLVIDRSGSMAGDKIQAARMAADRFVRGMRDGDELALITYGTDVDVNLPLTALNSATRESAARIIARIDEGGGTNIDGGLAAARALLTQANLVGRVGRVVLITDGRPTEGDTREGTLVRRSSDIRAAGLTLSTIGVGVDYNEDLMEHMAVDGGGRYHYLRTGDQLAQILDDELQHAASIAASQVRLMLPGFAGSVSVQGFGSNIEQVAGHGEVLVGDLAAGEERHVLVQLSGDVAGMTGFAAPTIRYVNAANSGVAVLTNRGDAFRVLPTSDVAQLERSRSDDVRVRMMQVEASLALTDSMKAYASGDSARAQATLRQNKDRVMEFAKKTNNAALARQAANFEDVLQQVSAAPAPASEQAQDMIKAQKARAYEERQ